MPIIEQLAPPRASPYPALESLLAAGEYDEAAFAEFYERTSPLVRAAVRTVLRDQAQADEVTQEVYLQAWQRAPAYRTEQGSVLGWLLTIARRRAVDRVRTCQAAVRRDCCYSHRLAVAAVDSVEDQVATRLDIEKVRHALGELGAAQREALFLSFFGGYTHPEIATLTGLPLGTVKTRIRDGRRRLSAALAGEFTPSPRPA